MTGEWRESTEGDLDPDLTEEAGYRWDPPTRRGWRLLYRVALVVTLTCVLGGALLVLLR